MITRSLSRPFSAAILAMCSIGMMAQTVFVPDPQFRAALNAWMPDLVDGDGNMLIEDANAVSGAWDLNVDWSPADLAGVEHLGIHSLVLRSAPANELVLDALPFGLQILSLFHYPGAELPSLGDLQVLSVSKAHLLEDLPELPPTLTFLELDSLPELRTVPLLPEGLEHCGLRYYPEGLSLPGLPSSLLGFELSRSLHEQLPDLPPALEWLVLDTLPLLTGAPLLPATLTDVRMHGNGLTALSFNVPSECTIRLDGMPALEQVIVNGGQDVVILRCPTLQMATLHLTGVNSQSSIGVAPLLTSLDVDGSFIGLLLEDLDVLVDLTMPQELDYLFMKDVGIPVLPGFPPSLTVIELDSLPDVTELPQLPASLQNLMLQDLPLLVCLPVLPEGLFGLILGEGMAISCLPNVPPSIFQDLPLCTVLHPKCPQATAVVTGLVFRDDDGDGVQGAGEPPIAGAVVGSMFEPYLTSTDSAGRYRLGVLPGNHTIGVLDPGILADPDAPPMLHDLFIGSVMDLADSIDMGVVPVGTDPDLEVRAVVVDNVRPGFTSTVVLELRNAGATTVHDAVMRYEPDPLFEFVSSDPPATQTAEGLFWDLDSIPFGPFTQWEVRLLASTEAELGYVLSDTVQVTVAQEEEEVANNTAIIRETVQGPYDPNDKRVIPDELHVDQLQEAPEVEYIIRFQNTGTFPAERVVITDTLSPNLQWGSFRFDGASHPCEWYMAGGVLHFVFDDIMLPDSTSDEPASHGQVRFSIVPQTGLMVGEEVDNTANIYFDFNEPVITLPAVLAVVGGTGLPDVEAAGERFCHPVPTDGPLLVHAGPVGTPVRIQVHDVSGRVVLDEIGRNDPALIDLADLRPGIYVVRTTGPKGRRAQRVLLQ